MLIECVRVRVRVGVCVCVSGFIARSAILIATVDIPTSPTSIDGCRASDQFFVN